MTTHHTPPELVALLACPFCGSASPKLIEFPNSMESLYRILCSDVRCMAMIEGHTKRRAELVWNRRAPTLPGAGGGDALDARRYRWLREYNTAAYPKVAEAFFIGDMTLDRAIDAALPPQQGG